MSGTSEILSLAREGLRVFPIAPKAKTPAIADWPNEASSDPERIRSWASRIPGCNWGAVTGAEGGIFVVDFDGAEGRSVLREWMRQNGPEWAETRAVKTAKGGHLWFRWPNGETRIKNSVGKIARGVDVRGQNGYILVPPSLHPDGPEYSWAGEPSAPIAQAPAWLIDLILKASAPQPCPGDRNGGGNGEQKIPAGERNATLTSLAGSMRKRGMAPEEIEAALLAVSARRCDPPLPVEEVRQIAASVGRYAPAVADKEGKAKSILANAIGLLREKWAGVLGYNEFSLHAECLKQPPFKRGNGKNWTDHDDLLTCEWLQRNGILVSSRTSAEAVQAVAMENKFHPVRDYLKSREWDCVPRCDKWLSTYLGADPTEWTKAIGARWLMSAVARIFEPGCQADHVLLLEGPQGIKKSTALRILASDEWFSDHISDLGSKDSRIELHGRWILEMAELDRVRRGEIERVKAFLTARIDNFRLPYGRRSEAVPRSCVFAATVNDQTPLTDETGNRRFWPVRCGEILIDSLTADRDQLWAEAYVLYREGEVWWLESKQLNELAKAEQDERYDEGVWDSIILDWLEEPQQRYKTDGGTQLPITPFDSVRGQVTVTDILIHAVGKDLDRCTQADRNQVARCLVHNGWKRKQWRSGTKKGKWFYEPVEPLVNQ